jgi:hypothetical protein
MECFRQVYCDWGDQEFEQGRAIHINVVIDAIVEGGKMTRIDSKVLNRRGFEGKKRLVDETMCVQFLKMVQSHGHQVIF